MSHNSAQSTFSSKDSLLKLESSTMLLDWWCYKSFGAPSIMSQLGDEE